MKIQYEVTVDDLVAFMVYQVPRSLRRQYPRGIVWIILLLGLFVAMVTLGWNAADLTGTLLTFFPLLFILGVLFEILYGRPNITRSFRKQYEETLPRGAVGLHELELTEDCLVERTAYSEHRTPLQDVQRVASDGTRTFLYIGPAMAHVIPHRAVSERDLAAFLEAVRIRRSEVPAEPPGAADRSGD